MTRVDEIVDRSIDYGQNTPSEYDDGRYDLSDLEWAFEEGVKWADKTMIEKACEWMKEMMQGHIVLEVLTGEHYEADLIKDFKKAMGEQQ